MKQSISVETLKGFRNWSCFNLEQVIGKDGKPAFNADGTPRMNKKPMNPLTGYGAPSDDSRMWTDYQTASAHVQRGRFSGVCFAFGDSGVCGVDLDHCIDDHGNLSAFAADVVQRLDSYTEYSPSGRGLHILVLSDVVFGGKSKDGRIEIYRPRKRTQEERQAIFDKETARAAKDGRKPKYRSADDVGDIHSGRFFTFTGNVYLGRPIADRTEEIRQLIAECFPPEPERPKVTSAPKAAALNVDGSEVMKRAERGANSGKIRLLYDGGGDDASSGDQALCNYLMYYGDNDLQLVDDLFRQSARMRPKWDEVHYSNGDTYGERTLQNAVQARTYSDDVAALRSTPQQDFSLSYDDYIGEDGDKLPEDAPQGPQSGAAPDPEESAPEAENAAVDVLGAVQGYLSAAGVYADDAEAFFVVSSDADAAALESVGYGAISLESARGTGTLAEALRRQPTKAALLLCLKGAELEAMQKGLSKSGNHFIAADLCGEYPNLASRIESDTYRFSLDAVRAVRDCFRPDNAASYLEYAFDADVKRYREGGKPTGFPHWDKVTTGLHEGLFMVAGTPGNGKTTLVYQIAEGLAAAGDDVLYFALEQSNFDLVVKSLARRCKVANMSTAATNKRIKEGSAPKRQLEEAKRGFLCDVGERLSIVPGNFALSAKDISDYVEAYMQRTGRKPCVVVDYLQALRPMDQSVKKGVREAIDDTTDCLCGLKNKHGLTMMVVSSVSRANYYTPLDMDALKESGRLEFSADAVWALELSCMADAEFQKMEIWQQKEFIRRQKKHKPRAMTLRCCKSRFSSVGDETELKYFAANDYFTESTDEFEKYDSEAPFDDDDEDPMNIQGFLDHPTEPKAARNPLDGLNRPR